MAATNDGLVESLTKSSDNDNSSNNSQAMNRKMRKTKTIGKRKLVSVKDDARRRAAREFLLGIKLDNENLHRFSPSHVLSVESVLASKVDTVAINAESNTPRLARTPSLRNSKDEQPLLIRQGSLKQQGGVVYKDNLSNQATPRSPYKVQSFDQNETIDHPLSTSIGSEDRFKLLRTNSAFARIEDQYSQNPVMTGQSYIILQGTPVIMFTVLPFRRRQGTRLLSGSKSIDFSEIDLDTDQEVSLGFLLMPVWSTLRDIEFQDHELESSGKDLESWMKYIHGFWKDNHSPDKVIVHYHPDHLDNEEVFYGRRAKTMHHASYMVSVIEYRKAESEKKDLNKRFRDVFPHIRVTLSKIRSIKKEMRQVSTEMQLDDGVLCYAFVYFEKMILMSKANKVNRKLLAGASLLVAAKFLDIERSRIKSLIHEITSIMKISSKDLLHAELPLLLGLQFSLFVPEHQYKRHWERLRLEES